MIYTLKYVKHEEGQYTGYLMEIPSVVAQSTSLEELKTEIKKGLEVMLDVLKEEEENQPITIGWEVAKKISIEL